MTAKTRSKETEGGYLPAYQPPEVTVVTALEAMVKLAKAGVPLVGIEELANALADYMEAHDGK